MSTFKMVVDSLTEKMATGKDYHQELMVLKILLPGEIIESRERRKMQRKLPLQSTKKPDNK